jgi:conjugal transfer/entry exclusion protein
MTVRRGRVLGCLLLCCWLFRPGLAHAQGVPVYDNANFIQNVITAIQTVFIVANQLLELTGLGEIVMGDDLSEEMEQLAAIQEEAGGLLADLQNIQLQITLLFELHTAPRSASALQKRMVEIRRLVFKVYVDALRVQSLMQSTVSALRHAVRLVQAIGDLLGNEQSNQTLVQLETRLTVELTKLKTQTAAFHKAQSFDRLQEPLILESLQLINIDIMEDHP